MKWKGRRASTNVQDARSRRVVRGRGGGRAVGTLIELVVRAFGLKGILVLLGIGFIGWQMGLLDPAMLLGGGSTVVLILLGWELPLGLDPTAYGLSISGIAFVTVHMLRSGRPGTS